MSIEISEAAAARLEEMRVAVAEHARAVAALEERERARARAVLAARRAGVSITALAAELGLSRPRVVQLAAWAEALPPAAAAGGRRTLAQSRAGLTAVPQSPVGLPEEQSLVELSGPCARLGCDTPVLLGSRFCAPHDRY